MNSSRNSSRLQATSTDTVLQVYKVRISDQKDHINDLMTSLKMLQDAKSESYSSAEANTSVPTSPSAQRLKSVARHIAPLPGYSNQIWPNRPSPYADDIRFFLLTSNKPCRKHSSPPRLFTLREWVPYTLPHRYLLPIELASHSTYDGLKQSVIGDLATRSLTELVA